MSFCGISTDPDMRNQDEIAVVDQQNDMVTGGSNKATKKATVDLRDLSGILSSEERTHHQEKADKWRRSWVNILLWI